MPVKFIFSFERIYVSSRCTSEEAVKAWDGRLQIIFLKSLLEVICENGRNCICGKLKLWWNVAPSSRCISWFLNSWCACIATYSLFCSKLVLIGIYEDRKWFTYHDPLSQASVMEVLRPFYCFPCCSQSLYLAMPTVHNHRRSGARKRIYILWNGLLCYWLPRSYRSSTARLHKTELVEHFNWLKSTHGSIFKKLWKLGVIFVSSETGM